MNLHGLAWGLHEFGISNLRKKVIMYIVKLSLEIQISTIKITWRYVNSQNTYISLQTIDFIDKTSLILYILPS